MKSLPRLLARLQPRSQRYKEIENQLYRIQAGYAGEVKVDRYLESIEFPEPVHIFTDLQLTITPKFAVQVDTLILTPSYAFILEIKNIAGTLTYITNPPHFESTYEDKKSIVIDCPTMQLNNIKNGLDSWLERNGFPMKTTGMIVMANTKSSIKNVPTHMPIQYAKHLPYFFRTKKIEKPVLSNQQFRSLIEKLSSEQTLYNPYPLCDRYRIDKTHIQKGVLCSKCNQKVIRLNRVVWGCATCRVQMKQPFVEGLMDWFMLMGTTISNEECRIFLELKDKYAANYILKSLPLISVGKSKATVYKWDYKISPSKIASSSE